MATQYDIPEDELRELYLQQEYSIQDCADHFGCSSTLIEVRLDRYGIPTRPPGGDSVDISEETLRELYVEQGLSTVEVAERFDCHDSTISRKLREHGIARDGPNHGNAMELPEDELVQLYVEEERTTYELADRYGCDPTVIERRLRWNDVEVRHTFSGGGEWEQPYGENWEERREAALDRAGHACEACGISEEEHRQRYVDETRGVGIGLDVHHVVRAGLFRAWDDASVEDANALRNLRVLCQACHARHGDRVGTHRSRE